MNKDVAALASRIRALRIQQGYATAEAFAKTHNIPIERYAAYETGTDTLLTEIFDIAQCFGLSMKEFFE